MRFLPKSIDALRDQLVQKRKRLGLSHREVAKLLDISSHESLWRLETQIKRRTLDYEILIKLLIWLNEEEISEEPEAVVRNYLKREDLKKVLIAIVKSKKEIRDPRCRSTAVNSMARIYEELVALDRGLEEEL